MRGPSPSFDIDVVSLLVNRIQNISDILLYCLRGDAMVFIPFLLPLSASVCFIQSIAHAVCNSVSIKNNSAFSITGSSANRLNKGGAGAQIPFLVSIQNTNKSTFRNIKTFTQQVNPYQNIKDAKPQIADNLNPLQRINI